MYTFVLRCHYICKFFQSLFPSEWVSFLSQKFFADCTMTHSWLTWSVLWQPYALFSVSFCTNLNKVNPCFVNKFDTLRIFFIFAFCFFFLFLKTNDALHYPIYKLGNIVQIDRNVSETNTKQHSNHTHMHCIYGRKLSVSIIKPTVNSIYSFFNKLAAYLPMGQNTSIYFFNELH